MRKALVAAIALAVAVGGLTATVGAGDKPEKGATPTPPEVIPWEGAQPAGYEEVFRDFQAINCGTSLNNRAEVKRTLRCINRNLTKLNSKLTRLSSDWRSFEACFLGVVPIAGWGDPAGSFGYVWVQGGQQILTTALDFTDPSDPEVLWAMILDGACVAP